MDQTLKQEADFRLSSILVPLLAIIAGVFMVVLDSTAMNVALSRLVVDFKTDLHTLQWVVTGYMLAQASVIPLSGWLSDRFGAKKVFLTAVIVFTIGSILCATPSSAEWLIVFRVIQGLGGGCVLPVGMAYVYRLAPKSKVGVVMGIMGIPVLFAPAIGPVLSGWLVEYHSWRWIFLINIPIGIIAVLIGLRKLPNAAKNSVPGMDKFGMVLGPLAFASLTYGVSQGAPELDLRENADRAAAGRCGADRFCHRRAALQDTAAGAADSEVRRFHDRNHRAVDRPVRLIRRVIPAPAISATGPRLRCI